MMEPYATLFFLRISTLSLGFVILVMGLNSHYRSSWVSLHVTNEKGETTTQLHSLCAVKYFYSNCPDIILEQLFVAVISINFICLLLGMLTFCLWYRDVVEFHPLKWLDLFYHGISAGILLAASIVYIISAIQIREFSGGIEHPFLNFRTEEKFTVGGLTIAQACLHVGIAALVGKCKREVPSIVATHIDVVNMTGISNGIDNHGINIAE